MNYKTVAELIVRCFDARNQAHIRHLKTSSYAEHEALKQFYEELIPLVDIVAEIYQGDYGKILEYPNIKIQPIEDALQLTRYLTKWIEQNRAQIADSSASHLQAAIDDILTLLSNTRYKLRFLE